MIVILFSLKRESAPPPMGERDILVYAHPADCFYGEIRPNSYYLEGYGAPAGDLPKITVREIASLMDTHKRIEML